MTYNVEQKAQAVALVQSGMSAQHAAAELGLPERSVQIWAKKFRETSAKEDDPILRSQSRRIAERAGELIHDALDEIEEGGEAKKYMAVLNAVRGTAIDKDNAARGRGAPDEPVSFIIIQPGKTCDCSHSDDRPAIEAEFTER